MLCDKLEVPQFIWKGGMWFVLIARGLRAPRGKRMLLPHAAPRHLEKSVHLVVSAAVTPCSRLRVSICIGVMCQPVGDSISCAWPAG